MKKHDVAEQIALEIIGHQDGIKEASHGIRNSWDGPWDANTCRESIIADKAALKALRNLAKKLGIYEEVMKVDV